MNTKRHRFLLTGGTGFVGSHVVEELLANGHDVRCLIRKGRSSHAWLAGQSVEIMEGDHHSESEMDRLMDGIDTVIHVAGRTKGKSLEDYRQANVEMTRHLISAAVRSGVDRLLYVSSLTAVGPSADGSLLDESSACVPITAYGISKLEAENVCRSYADDIALTVLRPPAVYGPRDKDILEMFRWVSYGLRPIVGSSEKTLSLIHVHDLARMIVAAAVDPRTRGKTYFVSDPKPYTFDTLIRTIADISEKRTFPLFIPAPLLYFIAGITQAVSALLRRQAVLTIEKARDILQPAWVCSSRAFTEDTGLSSQIRIDEGLHATFKWYKDQGWIA